MSPASAGTAGPHCSRKRRTSASCAGSRIGGGSGIQRFIWNGPLEPDRNFAAQVSISLGSKSKAPHPPMPPAFATAMESDGGQAPAIGANKIGISRPNRSQNSLGTRTFILNETVCFLKGKIFFFFFLLLSLFYILYHHTTH